LRHYIISVPALLMLQKKVKQISDQQVTIKQHCHKKSLTTLMPAKLLINKLNGPMDKIRDN